MRIPITEIEKEVNRYYETDPGQIFNRSRERGSVEKRQIFFYLAQKHTVKSLCEIGRYCEKYEIKPFDHTTVLYSHRNIGDLMAFDDELRGKVERITAFLRQNRNVTYTDNEILFKSELTAIEKRLSALESKNMVLKSLV